MKPGSNFGLGLFERKVIQARVRPERWNDHLRFAGVLLLIATDLEQRRRMVWRLPN